MSKVVKKVSWTGVFLLGMVFGVVLTALVGGFAQWFINTKPFIGTPEKEKQVTFMLPRAFMQAQDNGRYDKFLIKELAKEPVVPFKDNGEYYWQAFVCKNAKCPGRKGEVDYVFAAVVQNGEIVGCPLCKEVYAKTSGAEKKLYEPHNFRRYYTPKALQDMKKMREKIKSK